MYEISFLPQALVDIETGQLWYAERSEKASKQFDKRIQEAIKKLQSD